MAEPSADPKAAAAPLLVPIGAFAGNPPFKLTRPVLLAGTEEHCHLHLISSTVSKHHAILIVSPAVTYVRDLASRTGVFVNDHPVAEAVLKNGDRIMIGKFGFTYVGPTGKGKTELRTKPVTAVVDGDAMPGRVEGRVLMIGRRPGSDILLDAESVSLCHAVIFEFGGKRYLRDMDSRTGTYLQGKKIHQSEVKIGDRIRIGNSTLELKAYEVPQEKPVLRASAVMEVVEDLETGAGAGSTALPPHQPAPISQSTRPAPKPRPAEPQAIADKVDLNKDLTTAAADMAGETSAMESPFKAQGEEPKHEEVKLSPKPVAAASAPAAPAAAPVKDEPVGTWPKRGWRSAAVEPATPAAPVVPVQPVVPVVPVPPVAPVIPLPEAAEETTKIDLVQLEPHAPPETKSGGDAVVEATHEVEKVAVVETPAPLPQEAAIALPPLPLVEEIAPAEAPVQAPAVVEPEIVATAAQADVIPMVEAEPEAIAEPEPAKTEVISATVEPEAVNVETAPEPQAAVEATPEPVAIPVEEIAPVAIAPEPEIIAVAEESKPEPAAAPEPVVESPAAEATSDTESIPLADTVAVETPAVPEAVAAAPEADAIPGVEEPKPEPIAAPEPAAESPVAETTPETESIPLADAAAVEPDVIPLVEEPTPKPIVAAEPLAEAPVAEATPETEVVPMTAAVVESAPLPETVAIAPEPVVEAPVVEAIPDIQAMPLAEMGVADPAPEPEIISVVDAAAMAEPVEVAADSEWDVPPVEVATADLTASGDEDDLELPTELDSGPPADSGGGASLVDERLLDLGSFEEKPATLEIFPVKEEPTAAISTEEYPVVEISAPPAEPPMERGLGVSLEPEAVRPQVNVSSGFFQDGNGDGAGRVEEVSAPPEIQVTVDPAVISAAMASAPAVTAAAAATGAATAATMIAAAVEEDEEDVRPRKGKGKGKVVRGQVKRVPPRPAEPPTVEMERPEHPPETVESIGESIGESTGESAAESALEPAVESASERAMETTVTASVQDAAPLVPTLNLSGTTAEAEPTGEILGGDELEFPHHVEGEIFEALGREPAAETLEAEAEPRIEGLDLREADFSATDFGEASQAVHIPDAPAVTHEAEAHEDAAAVVERVIEPPVHEHPEVQDPQMPPEKTLDLDAALPAVEAGEGVENAAAAEPEGTAAAESVGSLGEIEQSFVEASTGPLVVTENPVELDHLPWGRDEMETGTEHAMELGPPLEPVAPEEVVTETAAELPAEPVSESPEVVATADEELLPAEEQGLETGTEQTSALEPVEIVATAPQSPVVAEPLPADELEIPAEPAPAEEIAVETPPAAAVEAPLETPPPAPVEAAAPMIPPPPQTVEPPPVQAPPPAQPPKPNAQNTWMGGVNLVQFFGGMPVNLKELPPAPKGFGRVNLDFGDAIKPRNAEGVPEIPPTPVDRGGEIPTLVGTPPEPPPIEPVAKPAPPTPAVPLPPPPPPPRAAPTLVPWPFAGDLDEPMPPAGGKIRQAPPTPGRAPRKETGGPGGIAPGPFDGLAMPTVRQKDVFSDLEVTPLNDAAFGGARLTRDDDYIVPDSPQTAARKSEEPDKDFAADDFWNRTDDQEGTAGGQVSEEERKSLSSEDEEDEAAGITGTTDLATVFPVVPAVTASRRIQPVSPRRPPVMAMDMADSGITARRYRRRLLGIALGGFASVALCVLGIMHFVPKMSSATGTLHVANFKWEPGTGPGEDFQSNQRHLLGPAAMTAARKHLQAEHPEISGGFLDSPDEFAPVAGSMALASTTEADGSHETTIQLTAEGTDAAADKARMTALLEALLDVNADSTAKHRQVMDQKAATDKQVLALQAQHESIAAKMQSDSDVASHKPDDDDVNAADDKLVQQWQSRAAAVRSVGTDLDKMSDDAGKMPPPLGQTASWGFPVVGLNSDRAAAAKDLDNSLQAPDAGAVAALGRLTDAIGTFNAAYDKASVTPDATGDLAVSPQTMLNVLLANAARLQTQITGTRQDVAQDFAAKQRALWARDPQVTTARAALDSAWHDLGTMITKGQATPAAVDAQQRQIALLTDALAEAQSQHPVDPAAAQPDSTTLEVLRLRRGDLSDESKKVGIALTAAGEQNGAVAPAGQELLGALNTYVEALQLEPVQLTDEQAGKVRVAEDLTDREAGVLNDYADQVIKAQDNKARNDLNALGATQIGLDKITLVEDRNLIRLGNDESSRSMNMDVLRLAEEAQSAESDSTNFGQQLAQTDTDLTKAQADQGKLNTDAESAYIVLPPSDRDVTVSTTDARWYYCFLAVVGVMVVFGLLVYAAIRSPQAAAVAAARA